MWSLSILFSIVVLVELVGIKFQNTGVPDYTVLINCLILWMEIEEEFIRLLQSNPKIIQETREIRSPHWRCFKGESNSIIQTRVLREVTQIDRMLKTIEGGLRMMMMSMMMMNGNINYLLLTKHSAFLDRAACATYLWNVFRKNGSSIPLLLLLSITERRFLPNFFLFEVVLQVNIWIMPLFTFRVSCAIRFRCFCCLKSLCDVVCIIWYNSLWYCSASLRGSEKYIVLTKIARVHSTRSHF